MVTLRLLMAPDDPQLRRECLATPEMRERLELLDMTIRASSPEEFARHIAVEMEVWGKVVRDSKISAAE
jgi:tripartite-type tricarboxylate transporter receptor subunit TctC